MPSYDAIRDRYTHARTVGREDRPSLDSLNVASASDTATELLESLDGHVLGLGAARRLAVASSPDVHAARARLEAARARIMEAQARFAPTVQFTHNSARTFHTPASANRLNTLLQPTRPVSLTNNSNNLAVTAILNALPLSFFGVGGPEANTSPFGEHSTALTVTWTLFDGFVREARTLAAKRLGEAAKHALADVDRLLVRAVDTAYYQVQLAAEQVRIAEADETFSRDQFEETKQLQAAGRAAQVDVDNFRVRMLAAQTNLAAAIGARETGRVVLAELMGLSQASLPETVALSPLEAESPAEMTAPRVSDWLERAAANRPDVAQLRSVSQSEDENVRAARGLFSPIVIVSGSWGFDRASTVRYRGDDQSSAGAIELRWDLYTGGSRRARVLLAQAHRAEARANLERRRLTTASEVRSSAIAVADAQKQIRLQRESLTTARENRRIIQVGYLAGKETLTRLNEAQRDFIEADANLARARIRLRRAWSDLRAASATYTDSLTGETSDGGG